MAAQVHAQREYQEIVAERDRIEREYATDRNPQNDLFSRLKDVDDRLLNYVIGFYETNENDTKLQQPKEPESVSRGNINREMTNDPSNCLCGKPLIKLNSVSSRAFNFVKLYPWIRFYKPNLGGG